MTPKQLRFVSEYLVDLNATAAAKRAGYSVRTAETIGWENLRKPEIAAAIQEAREDRARRTKLTQEEIIDGIRQDIEAARAAGRDTWKGWELLSRHWGLEARLKVDQTVQGAASGAGMSNMELIDLLPRPRAAEEAHAAANGKNSSH